MIQVTIYKMDIDEWKQEMIDKSYIDPEEYSLFVTMVSDIKSYVQSFKIKITAYPAASYRFPDHH